MSNCWTTQSADCLSKSIPYIHTHLLQAVQQACQALYSLYSFLHVEFLQLGEIGETLNVALRIRINLLGPVTCSSNSSPTGNLCTLTSFSQTFTS